METRHDEARILVPLPEGWGRLGIGRSKFYELIGQGRIRTVKIGRRVLVPTRELERFADELIEEAALERTA